MTTHDDDPIDVTAVSLDDELIERLRHSLSPDNAVVWDDDEDDLDPGYALLRALQHDVSLDLPVDAPILPAGVVELAPRRHKLGRGATVAAVAAGVLSLGTVAAAAAPGQPLSGVRSAVTSAVHNVVDAITPNTPVGPSKTPSDHASPTSASSPSPRPTPPGEAVSTAARSASAIAQVKANLDRASALLDDGRLAPAKEQLDAAERKLAFVTDPATHDALATRLAALRARLAATPTPKPTHGQPADKGKSGGNSSKDKSGKGGSSGATDGRSTEPRRPTSLPSKATSQDASVKVHPVKAAVPNTHDSVKGGAGHRDGD